MEERIKRILWVQEYQERPGRILIYEKEYEQMLHMEERNRGNLPRAVALRGRNGSGRKFLMGHLAYARRKRVAYVYMDALYECCVDLGEQTAEILRAFLEEYDSWLCLMDTRETEDRSEERWKSLLGLLFDGGISCYVITDRKLPMPDDGRCSYGEIRLPEPGLTQRERLWEYFLGQYAVSAEIKADTLSSRYRLNAGDIARVLVSAELYRDGAEREQMCQEDIRRALFGYQEENLGAYAQRIPVVYTWEDLIVDGQVRKNLEEICSQVTYQSLVGGRWGFYKKKPYGRGISALFYGPPGTGKTMAAQVIAGELGLELYRVDLSRMMSKYIGETQKNISSLFEKAAYMNIVLLFDEADAFFSKRTSVKDSHDRHANGEVAHLLQQMEDYEGVAILTSNLKDHMDDAFRRRIKRMVEFRLPGVKERLRLWQKAIPEEAPKMEKLRLEIFAERFEISAGEIQEVALQAAFRAAAEGSGIGNRHMEEAIRECYLKYGKILLEEEFE